MSNSTEAAENGVLADDLEAIIPLFKSTMNLSNITISSLELHEGPFVSPASSSEDSKVDAPASSSSDVVSVYGFGLMFESGLLHTPLRDSIIVQHIETAVKSFRENLDAVVGVGVPATLKGEYHSYVDTVTQMWTIEFRFQIE